MVKTHMFQPQVVYLRERVPSLTIYFQWGIAKHTVRNPKKHTATLIGGGRLLLVRFSEDPLVSMNHNRRGEVYDRRIVPPSLDDWLTQVFQLTGVLSGRRYLKIVHVYN